MWVMEATRWNIGDNMKVILSVHGYLQTFFDQSCYELELNEGATLADLFLAIDRRFGASLPKSVWSHEKQKFRGPVSISVEQNMVSDPAFPLAEGQQVSITRFLIGG